ncbi:uncharacterized protein LOC120453582 [Drosophila santomea]|uniref:uncharacterized protein LOC120453582 n=1 Tax=Drosophila santomea TaxID=129105 RepID=UPI001953F54A|nr:uncharacterized protein LOC120453582 [Drosophila santomea]XP_039494276.1 uncharacterized protein LOC120453582 [Drosophila santomea]
MNRIRRIRRMCERLPHKLHFNFGAFLATAYKSTEFQQTRRRRQLLASPPDSLRLRVAPGGSCSCGLFLMVLVPPALPAIPSQLRARPGQATRNIEISI